MAVTLPVAFVSFKALRRAALAAAVSLAAMAGPALAQNAPKVKFVTSEGDFVVEVYPDKAPKPVENFLQYVKDKHYENTARAQLVNAPQHYGYTVFGKVVSGMDVINKIKSVPTGAAGPFPTDAPKTPVLIKSATLVN